MSIKGQEGLLEEAVADERGFVYEPRQQLFVESFDACVPVRVYPNGTDVVGLVGNVQAQADIVGYPV